MKYSAGKYSYELIEGWAKLPQGWSFLDVSGIAADAQNRVYVLNRSEHPIMVFDDDGNFIASWGEGLFKRAHGSCISADGYIYCTDIGHHTVSKYTLDGKLVMEMGAKDQPSDTGFFVAPGKTVRDSQNTIRAGGPPFNQPTGVALSRSGDIYITDGYGNARVHRFSPEGKLLYSWGEPGNQQGEFRIPHALWVDKNDQVWVVDRENSRIQIFNKQGEFLSQWTDLIRPAGIFIDDEGIVYVSELSRRVTMFTLEGRMIARWTDPDKESSLLLACHSITVNSRGDVYIGTVAMKSAKVDRGSLAVLKFKRE